MDVKELQCEAGHRRLVRDTWIDLGCKDCQLTQARDDFAAIRDQRDALRVELVLLREGMSLVKVQS